MGRDEVAEQIKQSGIIAIIRGSFALDDIQRIADALLAGGVRVMEVTLNSNDALAAITQLRQRGGSDLLVGAGTVRTAEQVIQAVKAGAQFMVSPNFDAAAVARSLAAKVLHLPGVATPTEAQNAFMAGCTMVKLFPVDVLGGPAYLKAIRAPLNDIEFVPTGGISVENIAEYRKAGAVAVGVGGSLVSDKNWSGEEIQLRGIRLRAAWEGT